MKKILLSMAFAGLGLSVNSFAQSIVSQNFETAALPAIPAGWANTHTGGTGTGWITSNSALNWYFTQIPAHTKFAVVNDWNDSTKTPSYLSSPVFSLVGATGARLAFDYFYIKAYYGSTAPIKEMAWVDISTDGGTSWTLLDSISASSYTSATGYVWFTKYVDFSTYVGQANVKIRFGYTDNGRKLPGLAIDNIDIINPQANDIALIGISPLPKDLLNGYKSHNDLVNFAGTVLNRSNATITAFDVTYKAGSSAAITTHITGVSIPAFTTYNFTCTPYPMPSMGTKAVTMWVTLVGDPVLTNDTMTTEIYGVFNYPVKKVVMEEGTGTWCGYCVRGIVYMDSLMDLHGNNVSLIAVHNGDPMASFNTSTSGYDSYLGSGPFGTGYPRVIVDRTYVMDPSALLSAYSQLTNNFGFADIAYTHTLTGTSLSLAIKVRPGLDLNGDYRLVVVTTEERVHGSGSAWDQHNYYSYQFNNEALSGRGFDYQAALTIIPSSIMYYDHVARSIDPSNTGNTGLLPAAMVAGNVYTATLTATIPATVDVTKAKFIVMLLDNATSRVLNTQNIDGTLPPTGIAEVNPGVEGLSIFPNPADVQTNVEFTLQNSGSVSVNVFDITGRNVYSSVKNMNSGIQKITIPVSSFTIGIYNVVIGTNSGTVSEKLSVIK